MILYFSNLLLGLSGKVISIRFAATAGCCYTSRKSFSSLSPSFFLYLLAAHFTVIAESSFVTSGVYATSQGVLEESKDAVLAEQEKVQLMKLPQEATEKLRDI